MVKDAQALKIEIVSNLDRLSPENLQLVDEFVTYLCLRTQQPEAAPATVLESNDLPEGPPSSKEEIPAAGRVGWKEWDQHFDQ